MDQDNKLLTFSMESGSIKAKYSGRVHIDFRIDLETTIKFITGIRKAVQHGKRSNQGAEHDQVSDPASDV